MSYQKKDGRGHARPSFSWYDNDKDLKVCFLVTHVVCECDVLCRSVHITSSQHYRGEKNVDNCLHSAEDDVSNASAKHSYVKKSPEQLLHTGFRERKEKPEKSGVFFTPSILFTKWKHLSVHASPSSPFAPQFVLCCHETSNVTSFGIRTSYCDVTCRHIIGHVTQIVPLDISDGICPIPSLYDVMWRHDDTLWRHVKSWCRSDWARHLT